MILTCPACTMRYLVSEGSVGPDGRRVRCAHCGHQWFQEGEEGLDTELFTADAPVGFGDDENQDQDDDPFETADAETLPAADEDDFQSILQKQLEESPIPEGVRPIHDDVVLPDPNRKKARPHISGQKLGGFATAAAVWLVLIGLLFYFYPQVSRAWPASNLLYNLVGLPPVPPGEGLALDSLTAVMGDGKILLKGNILNLMDSDKSVPAIMATIVDKNEKPIDRVMIAPPVANLKREGQASFDVLYPKIPDGAANVNFAFSFIKVNVADAKPEPAAPAKAAPEAAVPHKEPKAH